MRLLYVEDNERLAHNTCASLKRYGFVVDATSTAEDAVAAAEAFDYDAIILDLGLPDGDGLTVLSHLKRSDRDFLVIICSARDTLDDRIEGLNAGSDDYLVKPFAIEELVARVRALLRRPGGALGVALSAGNVRFDTITRSLTVGNEIAKLSKREMDLLELFLRRKGRVLTKETIESGLYGFDAPPTPNAIEVATHRLRKKLEQQGANIQIHTMRGIGYMLDSDTDA